MKSSSLTEMILHPPLGCEIFAYTALLYITFLSAFSYIPVFLQMFVYSIVLIYLGAYASLKFFAPVSKEGADAEPDTNSQVISVGEAWRFPIVASVILFGLFLAFQYIDKQRINILLMIYFSYLGTVATKTWIESFFLRLNFFRQMQQKKIPFFNNIKYKYLRINFNQLDVLCFIFAGTIAVFSILYKGNLSFSWVFNNIFGSAFCIFGLANLFLGQFKVGIILLWGLFVYDIFWVFGTTVMINVATNLDAPIMLMFPHPPVEGKEPFSKLGLGDVVIPGIFVALCLRFDYIKHFKACQLKEKKEKEGETEHTSVGMPVIKKRDDGSIKIHYFLTCIIFYGIGIGLTYVSLVVFNAAQPALLYLVPCCTLSVLILAGIKGDFSTILSFNEETELKILSDYLLPKKEDLDKRD
jgi:minor histocompatibility antigen H13